MARLFTPNLKKVERAELMGTIKGDDLAWLLTLACGHQRRLALEPNEMTARRAKRYVRLPPTQLGCQLCPPKAVS